MSQFVRADMLGNRNAATTPIPAGARHLHPFLDATWTRRTLAAAALVAEGEWLAGQTVSSNSARQSAWWLRSIGMDATSWSDIVYVMWDGNSLEHKGNL